MFDRLEWADTASAAVLLYPGTDIDDAVVEPGEIAVAIRTGSNGIALYGTQQQLADRLQQLSNAVRTAPPVLQHAACIAAAPASLPASGTVFLEARRTRCRERATVAADPRQATCPYCIEDHNADPATPDHLRIRLSRPVPALPDAAAQPARPREK
ncbi:hypothetical protein [Streptomyces melanogenes]|uniref:hypothetical protein n=1 Tax=Streptomyces melanogenes TaxID=67326 RepID=UPI00167CA4FF|nr:hypothetical protein [Streptomyces melanogenes]GGP80847.1 hypothetical protein GCM10010278_69230 [Streptomyces melanogenes]